MKPQICQPKITMFVAMQSQTATLIFFKHPQLERLPMQSVIVSTKKSSHTQNDIHQLASAMGFCVVGFLSTNKSATPATM